MNPTKSAKQATYFYNNTGTSPICHPGVCFLFRYSDQCISKKTHTLEFMNICWMPGRMDDYSWVIVPKFHDPQTLLGKFLLCLQRSSEFVWFPWPQFVVRVTSKAFQHCLLDTVLKRRTLSELRRHPKWNVFCCSIWNLEMHTCIMH